MPIVAMQNPWARMQGPGLAALEAQRNDLFTVNFTSAYDEIVRVLQRATQTSSQGQEISSLLRSFPSKGELGYFPCAVEFPSSAVGVNQGKRHEVPVPYPGQEELYGSVAINFLQDASGDANLNVSKINAFLRGWRALVRAGRAGLSSGDISLGLQEASADGNGYVPHFKHNFQVELWRGNSGSGAAAEDGEMELATRWTVYGAWLQALQMGSLTSKGGAALETRAVFAASAIGEGNPGGVQIGVISYPDSGQVLT